MSKYFPSKDFTDAMDKSPPEPNWRVSKDMPGEYSRWKDYWLKWFNTPIASSPDAGKECEPGLNIDLVKRP